MEIKPDEKDLAIAATAHFVHGLLAADSGDTKLAPAEEAVGHSDKADAVLKTGGTFVDCYRFHGDILDGRGDWKGAQEWYAKSVEVAPDLPAGYYSWGRPSASANCRPQSGLYAS